jgi:hypothetical protein
MVASSWLFLRFGIAIPTSPAQSTEGKFNAIAWSNWLKARTPAKAGQQGIEQNPCSGVRSEGGPIR